MLALPLYDDNPISRPPLVTFGLIAACVVVFLWQAGLAPRAAESADYAYGLVPAVLFGYAHLPPRLMAIPPWATLFTSMFLHGGWLHLIDNMVYLWLFGRGVESALGSLRFLLFYPLCGVAAALVQAGMAPHEAVPMIGASGAIAGTLGAYLMLYPRGNVVVLVWILFFVRLITVPAVILLGFWFLMQLLSATSTTAGDPGVAFWAHIGGFLFGMALVFVFRRPGHRVLQPRRNSAFALAPVRDARRAFGRGSVPSAGRPRMPPAARWW
jgi:membrane associated rhomboid family serine protease